MKQQVFIPVLLFFLSIACIAILSFLLLTQQNNTVIFRQGFRFFETSEGTVGKSSQAKEESIRTHFRAQETPKPPQEPTKTDTSNPDNSKTKAVTDLGNPNNLAKYEQKLHETYLWGTYKPYLVHAITQRKPQPLTFGYIYVQTEDNSRLFHSYRDVKDSRSHYTEFLYHDGKQFSESIFKDSGNLFEGKNYFYKEKMLGDRQRWHSVTYKEKSGIGFLNNQASLIYYFNIENFETTLDARYLTIDATNGVIKVNKPGEDPEGYFKIVIYDKEGKLQPFASVTKFIYMDDQCSKQDTWRVKSILQRQMQVDPALRFRVIPDNVGQKQNGANLIAVQLVLDPYGSFDVHVVYDNEDKFDDVSNNYKNIQDIKNIPNGQFMKEYDSIFTKSVPTPDKTCAISAVSNLISGLGYFYGPISIKNQFTPEPYLPLYTGSPSKTTFPRGFLWDEGFHGLIYCKWNADICVDALRSWLGTQLSDGWIPREQIRGEECKSYGHPDYLQVVKDEANPPTLLFLVRALIDYQEVGSLPVGGLELMNTLYPRMKKWFEWFYATQTSEVKEGLFAWRSNEADMGLVLGSGLDDYPRGLNFGRKPLAHLDLHMWMSFMAENMHKIAIFAGQAEDAAYFKRLLDKMKDDMHHFLDSTDHIYKDLVVDHSNNKVFANHFGYVNLFPLIFGYIDKESMELDSLLDKIRDTEKIWSPYGLLSLAKDDPLYMRTRDAYWGGPIWINLNYLVLRGLKLYYYDVPRARETYEELRANVIRNVCKVKEDTGYFHEQFNQDHGAGQKGAPFTGWTATVALIIYEKY